MKRKEKRKKIISIKTNAKGTMAFGNVRVKVIQMLRGGFGLSLLYTAKIIIKKKKEGMFVVERGRPFCRHDK